MVNEIFEKFSHHPQVEAIVLGGSRASGNADEKSDYDVYVYLDGEFDEKIREEILTPYCSQLEIGNKYWEYEDNCILNNGVGMDIIYRTIDRFDKFLGYVVNDFFAQNGYTTCFWHNVITSEIIFDRNGKYAEFKKKYDIPYPKQLKENIINKNMKLLNSVLPSYDLQIKKALDRNDYVSVNHRIAGFLASYFDIIFALNEKTHPGEKKLVKICLETCPILPESFEENLTKLLTTAPDASVIMPTIADMIEKLRKII